MRPDLERSQAIRADAARSRAAAARIRADAEMMRKLTREQRTACEALRKRLAEAAKARHTRAAGADATER